MYVKLKVHADARESRIVRKSPDAFEAWVKAPAERGLANFEALGLVAGELGVQQKRLRLIKGATCPAKIIEVL